MKLLVKGNGMDGMSMHLVNATNLPLCGMHFNPSKWHIQDRHAPTGYICAHCQHKQAIAAKEPPQALPAPPHKRGRPKKLA